jgi:DHA2 family multidrug resistance protein
MLSTVLDRRVAFHRSMLAAHLTPDVPQVTERIAQLSRAFESQGVSEAVAHARALSLLDGMLMRQASVLSFNDTFFVTAALVLGILPLVFLLGKPGAPQRISDVH